MVKFLWTKRRPHKRARLYPDSTVPGEEIDLAAPGPFRRVAEEGGVLGGRRGFRRGRPLERPRQRLLRDHVSAES